MKINPSLAGPDEGGFILKKVEGCLNGIALGGLDLLTHVLPCHGPQDRD